MLFAWGYTSSTETIRSLPVWTKTCIEFSWWVVFQMLLEERGR